MITTTTLYSLRLLEYYETMTLLYGELSQLAIEEEKIKTALTDFKTRLDAYDKALILVRGSELTVELEELDARRDAAFLTLINLLRALQKSPVEETSGAASLLYALVERYGKDIHRQAYMQESGNLINLLQDFESEPYASKAEALGIKSSLDVLKAANAEFDRVYGERLTEAAGKNKGLAKTEKIKLQDSFEKLCQLTVAGATWTGEAIYLQIENIINSHVANARQKVAQRMAIRKGWDNRKAGSGEDTPVQPTTE